MVEVPTWFMTLLGAGLGVATLWLKVAADRKADRRDIYARISAAERDVAAKADGAEAYDRIAEQDRKLASLESRVVASEDYRRENPASGLAAFQATTKASLESIIGQLDAIRKAAEKAEESGRSEHAALQRDIDRQFDAVGKRLDRIERRRRWWRA